MKKCKHTGRLNCDGCECFVRTDSFKYYCVKDLSNPYSNSIKDLFDSVNPEEPGSMQDNPQVETKENAFSIQQIKEPMPRMIEVTSLKMDKHIIMVNKIISIVDMGEHRAMIYFVNGTLLDLLTVENSEEIKKLILES